MPKNYYNIKTIFLGILFVMISAFSGSSFDAVTKYISLSSLKWYHYYSIGNSFSLIIFLIYLFFSSGIKNNILFKKKRDYILPVLRGLLFIPIPIIVFYSLKIVPLNLFSTLIATTPFFIYIFSILIQKERISLKFWLILFVGFLGANLVIKPSFSSTSLTVLLVMVVVIHNGWTNVIVSKYSHKASTNSFTFYFVFPLTILSILLFFIDPIILSYGEILFICLGGFLVFLSIFFWTAAYHIAGKYSSIISPFTFSQILWGSVYGYLFYGEIFDLFSIIGIFLIITSGIITIINTPKL